MTVDQIHRAWESFLGSDIQILFHRWLTEGIDSDRTALENAAGGDVVRLQEAIRLRRQMLAKIHDHDGPQLTKRYANDS